MAYTPKKPAATQPDWVCFQCGRKHKVGHWREFSTWHHGMCGVCNEEVPVTEPCDIGYLKASWLKDKEKWAKESGSS
jgi:hypothetical protein